MPPGQRGLLAEALDRGPAGAHHRPRPIPPYAHFPSAPTHTHTARTRARSLGSLGALVQLQPVGEVIANASRDRRCPTTAAAQAEPPKKRRRTKAAGRQPPSPGPTASAPTSPSAAGRLQFRPIMPAPDLRAFQPLPGALWLPLGQPPPPTVVQAHADPTQSPVPSCGGTSSPAPSPSPSPVDSCVDMSPIPIELEGFSNRGLSNSPETAKACANESLEGTCCCVFSVSAL